MKRLRKLWLNKFFKNYFLLMVCFTIMELIFRFVEGLSLFSYSSLRIFIGVNILALIFGLILDYLPKIVAKIFNPLMVLLLAIYGIAEIGFNHFLGVYVSIQTKSQASAVTSYATLFLESLKWQYYLLLIPFVILLIYYIFIDKKVDLDLPKKKITKKIVGIKILYFLILFLMCFGYHGTLKAKFMQNELQAVTAYELFKQPSLPSLVVNDFGYIGFGILDIKEYLFPGEDITLEIEYDPNKIMVSNMETPEEEQIVIDNEIWNKIIEDEKDKNYSILNKYFISNDITYTNEYTGLFEGKNLIVIMLESGSNLILNEEYYPNMAKIYKNGWSWDNYYSPRNTCSTGNNEMSGMTGLYSIYNNCTANVYKKNKYFESIFNIFNDSGYSTNSLHDHFDTYYDRTIIHPNMGSGKFYKLQDLDIPYNKKDGWANDEDFMTTYLEILDSRENKEQPFMTWITTVTSHHPYNKSNIFNDEYFDIFPEDIPDDVKRYMSKLKFVDNALGILLDGLAERGLLKDTVIAIYADHYPYAINSKDLNEVFEYDVSVDNNADQVPFVIYNPDLEETHFEEYTSYVNITPTLANLFGLKYDSRLYIGQDILSDEYESMVVFADGSWKNEVAYYTASTNSVQYYTEKVYSNEEILAINEKISLKLKMSSLAIKKNYFNYLDKRLESYITSE